MCAHIPRPVKFLLSNSTLLVLHLQAEYSRRQIGRVPRGSVASLSSFSICLSDPLFSSRIRAVYFTHFASVSRAWSRLSPYVVFSLDLLTDPACIFFTISNSCTRSSYSALLEVFDFPPPSEKHESPKDPRASLYASHPRYLRPREFFFSNGFHCFVTREMHPLSRSLPVP